ASAAPARSAASTGRRYSLMGRWACDVASTISSDGSGANTSTAAPAAESSSAFHAAPPPAPARTTRLPSSAKNTGRRANAAMRGPRASGGLKNLSMHDFPQFRQARTAVGAGTQRPADGIDARAAVCDRAHDRLLPDAETGADQGAGQS